MERYEYQLEYGTDCVEIHKDAIIKGHRVVLMDDLMATGGTMSASVELIRRVGGIVVACGVIVDLPGPQGRGAPAGPWARSRESGRVLER